MNFLGEIITFLSSDSLSSTIITLYTLMFLYFPSIFLQFIFSPIIFSTLILLLYLLRLGAQQKSAPQQINPPDDPTASIDPPKSLDRELIFPDSAADLKCKPDPDPYYADSFVEWDLRAPLEVIYEEYEGEEEAEEEGEDVNDAVSGAKRESEVNIIQRYASLSLYYPESDSEGSSEDGDWDSPGNMCFRWEGEGLIEIALDEKRNWEVEEENLIEIDLFPAR